MGARIWTGGLSTGYDAVMYNPTISSPSADTTATPRRLGPTLGRLAGFVLGMAILSAGILLLVRNPWGAASWDVFHLGVVTQTGLTLGTVIILVSAALVLITLVLGGGWTVRPGTVANAVLAGVFVDLYDHLGMVPEPSGWLWGAGYLIGGVVAMALGMVLYLRAGFGAGARDGLMLAVSQRARLSPGRARMAIEVTVVLLGWLLGGPLGPATVIAAVATGPVSDLFFRILGAGALAGRVRVPGERRAAPSAPRQQEVPLADGKQ